MPSEALVEQVLQAVELVPRGAVVAYGDIADLVGCGPRQVGAILREYGGGVPWWRVTNARGDMHDPDRCAPHWRAESIPLRPDGNGCAISRVRADLADLADSMAASRVG